MKLIKSVKYPKEEEKLLRLIKLLSYFGNRNEEVNKCFADLRKAIGVSSIGNKKKTWSNRLNPLGEKEAA
ncbi:MAG: hypothetical protein HQK89_17335 [Nitrospirae bacterium]|nr:hypothetical protein [Nitrospirota bacterium]